MLNPLLISMSSSAFRLSQRQENLFSLSRSSEQILRVKNGGTNIPAILVGNKIDLAEKRKVTPEEAERKAHSWSVRYIETSARLNSMSIRYHATSGDRCPRQAHRFFSLQVFCELMRIVRPFKHTVRDTGPAPTGGSRPMKPPKPMKSKKCAIL